VIFRIWYYFHDVMQTLSNKAVTFRDYRSGQLTFLAVGSLTDYEWILRRVYGIVVCCVFSNELGFGSSGFCCGFWRIVKDALPLGDEQLN